MSEVLSAQYHAFRPSVFCMGVAVCFLELESGAIGIGTAIGPNPDSHEMFEAAYRDAVINARRGRRATVGDVVRGVETGPKTLAGGFASGVLEGCKTATEESVRPDEIKTAQTTDLPAYRSHKLVHAAKITGVQMILGGNVVLYLEDTSPVLVSQQYADKHQPAVGGYYVRYADGYESWSPAEAFEEGYSKEG